MASFKEAFDAEKFRQQGYKVVDMLAQYLQQATTQQIDKVLDYKTPEETVANWRCDFSQARDIDTTVHETLSQVIDNANHLHHPKYIGHQVCAPLPLAALCDLVTSQLNNGNIYEMGPANMGMERQLVDWMAQMIGYDNSAGGIFTSGGSVGNLTALLAARQIKSGDAWQNGTTKPVAVLVSQDSHYSIQRALQIMGSGAKGAIAVPVDAQHKMDIAQLQPLYQQAQNAGYQVIAVVANGCSTATGSYDPIDSIADFCQNHNLWLHVDGAHGAAALLSPKYRSLLHGIQRADSVVWDAHKMMLMPSLITAVIFRSDHSSYQAFSQKASYIFDKSKEWYNQAQRTLECTRSMIVLKLYLSLKIYGVEFFSQYLDYCYDLARQFADLLKSTEDFEIPVQPESNIVCFRYCPNDSTNLDDLQQHIRRELVHRGSFYLVQTQLPQGLFLRVTLVNPFTTIETLQQLLSDIRML